MIGFVIKCVVAAVLLIAFHADLLQEYSRFRVMMTGDTNQSQMVVMMRMLLLKKGNKSLDTSQWIILLLKAVGILMGRVCRKQKEGQRMFVIPLGSLLLLPQLRRRKEDQRNVVL
jgi:hypothetical protein